MSEFSSLPSPDAISDEKFKAALVHLSRRLRIARSHPAVVDSSGGRKKGRGRVRTEPRPATWLVQAPVPDRIHPSTPQSPLAWVSCSSLCPAGLAAIAFSSSRSPIARDGHRVRIRTEKDADRASDVVDRIGAHQENATREGGRRPQCGDPGGDSPDPERSGQERRHAGHAIGGRFATHPMRSGATAISDVELDRQFPPVDERR
jgi:hypothetical protein